MKRGNGRASAGKLEKAKSPGGANKPKGTRKRKAVAAGDETDEGYEESDSETDSEERGYVGKGKGRKKAREVGYDCARRRAIVNRATITGGRWQGENRWKWRG